MALPAGLDRHHYAAGVFAAGFRGNTTEHRLIVFQECAVRSKAGNTAFRWLAFSAATHSNRSALHFIRRLETHVLRVSGPIALLSDGSESNSRVVQAPERGLGTQACDCSSLIL